MQAVANGSLPVVAAILRAGAELDARDKTGATAVSISATMGFTDVARLLANAGAALDIADQQGSSPLLVAAAGGHLDTVRARPRARSIARDALLHRPLRLSPFPPQVNALLELGADPNLQDAEGMTALMEAARAPRV